MTTKDNNKDEFDELLSRGNLLAQKAAEKLAHIAVGVQQLREDTAMLKKEVTEELDRREQTHK